MRLDFWSSLKGNDSFKAARTADYSRILLFASDTLLLQKGGLSPYERHTAPYSYTWQREETVADCLLVMCTWRRQYFRERPSFSYDVVSKYSAVYNRCNFLRCLTVIDTLSQSIV